MEKENVNHPGLFQGDPSQYRHENAIKPMSDELQDAIENLIQQMRNIGPIQIDTRHRSIK